MLRDLFEMIKSGNVDEIQQTIQDGNYDLDAPEVENGQFKNALVNLQGEEGNKKICAYCAETIKFNAIVCRYCSRDV